METELRVPHPAFLGGFLFILSAPVHFLVVQDVSVSIAAITLALIGGAYIGFGAQSDSIRKMLMELLVACLFGMAAIAGLLWHWSAIPIGLVVHALWDLLHHKPHIGVWVPRWYVPFCIVFDLMAAVLLVVLYAF